MLADKIEFIVSSPLKRTIETAELVNAQLNLPVRVDERLTEFDCGEIEGRRLKDVSAAYGEERICKFLSFHDEQSLNKCLPGGETKRAALTRTINALLDIAMTERAQKIGVSSHGLIMMILMSYAGCERVLPPANGDIVRIMYTNKKGIVNKGSWQFVELIPNIISSAPGIRL